MLRGGLGVLFSWDNALVEIAKDIREIRDTMRSIRVTQGGRFGVASYVSGITPSAKRAIMSELIAAIVGRTKTDVLRQQKQAARTEKIEQ